MGTGLSFEQAKEMTKMTFEYSDYKQVAYLKNGMEYTDKNNLIFEINKFSEDFSLTVIERDGGNQKIFVDSWNNIKKSLI